MNIIKRVGMFITFLVLLAQCSLISLANGGPVGSSGLATGGRVEFINIDNIEVAKEILDIRLGAETVDVKVTYELINTGESRTIDYAFPVTLVKEEHSEGIVQDFKMTSAGEELSYTHQTKAWDEEDYNIQEKTDYYISQLNFDPGETKILNVEYTVNPAYLDWATSKRTFPYFDQRTFQYDLLPAANWGDGVIKSFELIVDATDVFDKRGYITECSFDMVDITAPQNHIQIDNLKIEENPILHIKYNLEKYYLDQYIKKHDTTSYITALKASSTLEPKRYGLLNIIDDDLSTCWVEGSIDDNGEGQWIEITFSEPVYIESLLFTNGFYINEEYYYKNSRIKKMTVEYENGPKDNMKPNIQTFEYDNRPYGTSLFERYSEARLVRTCSKIKLTIDEVYEGTQYKDLCLSEILLIGSPYEGEEQQEILIDNNVNKLLESSEETEEKELKEEVAKPSSSAFNVKVNSKIKKSNSIIEPVESMTQIQVESSSVVSEKKDLKVVYIIVALGLCVLILIYRTVKRR